MQYFIFDKDFYSQTIGSTSVIKPSDIASISRVDPLVSVAVVDYLPKIVVTSESNQQIKEDTILRNFDKSLVLQDEKISSNTFQVIGIESEDIKQIYASFKNCTVSSVIPYGLAIRAFLKSRDLAVADKVVVFIDKLDDKILLTFLNDMVYTRTSKIIYSNTEEILSEIKRHIQNYTSVYKKESTEEITYLFVTNSDVIHALLLSQNILGLDDCILLDSPFPAIEGHSSARFDLHFLLPEDLLRLRKLQNFKTRLKVITLAGVLLSIGTITCIAGFAINNASLSKFRALQNNLQVIKAELVSENLKHYHDYFVSRENNKSAALIYEFLSNIPVDHFVQEYSITKIGEKRKFEGIIAPGTKSMELDNFLKRGYFKSAKVEYILLNNQPSQRVTLIY